MSVGDGGFESRRTRVDTEISDEPARGGPAGRRSPVADRLRRDVSAAWLRIAGGQPIDPRLVVVRRAPGGLGHLSAEIAGHGDLRGMTKSLAAELGRVEGVEAVHVRPPRIYITYDQETLARIVVEAAGRRPVDPAALGRVVAVNFGNPNANKPLHIGHLRDIALGNALSALFEATGHRVLRWQTISDWGVHIWHAATAYLRWGAPATPATAHLKPDHFVGSFLVRYSEEVAKEVGSGAAPDGVAPLEASAREANRCADGDPALQEICGRVSGWAIEGFGATYRRLGVVFDVESREATARRLSNALIATGIERGVFLRRFDGSVYADLTSAGLFSVTLQRQDGTLTVFGQLIGVQAELHARTHIDQAVVVFGREWERGFRCNREVWRRLGFGWADRYEGVPHGLVALPSGRMRSRSGAVERIDDVLDAVVARLAGELPVTSTHERLAVVLHTWWSLSAGRTVDLVYDADTIMGEPFRRLARLLRAYVSTAAPGEPAVLQRVARRRTPDLTRLLMLVDGVPDSIHEAVARRDPSVVVQLLDKIAIEVARLDGTGSGVPVDVGSAVNIAIRQGCASVGLALPEPADVAAYLGERPPAREAAS